MMRAGVRAESQEKETGRIEAFSDGVLAIVITLLVLDIKVPLLEEAERGGLWASLVERAPNFIAFVVSFFFILVMWINHHRLFTAIRRSDNNLLILNGLLLFGISLVPFSTALLAEYLGHEGEQIALLVYNGWYVVMAIFFNVLWWYSSYRNRLFSEKTDPALVSHLSRQFIVGPFAYGLVLLLGFINPYLSLAGTVVLAIFYALPNSRMSQLMAGDKGESAQ